MKIAVIGTHGIGKTTLVTNMYLYTLEHSSNSRVICEVARECPLGINQDFNIDSAVWIVTEQIKRELSAKATGADFIICDRSSIDPLMYSQAKFGGIDNLLLSPLYELANAWLSTYDKIIWMRPSSTSIPDDGRRDLDIMYRKSVDNAFEIFMRKYMDANPSKDIFTVSSSSVYKRNLSLFFKNQLLLYPGEQ